MQKQHIERVAPRVEFSSVINCQRSDFSKIAGKACNLSTGGIAIKTNYPIRKREQLTIEFPLPNTGNLTQVEGEVVWRLFHGDSLGPEGKLFSAGIKFVKIEKHFRASIVEYIQGTRA